MKDTVLFDFDGTIMNTNDVILKSWHHTFDTYGKERPADSVLYSHFGEPLEITVKKYFPDIPVAEGLEVYRSYHRDNFGEMITVFPGMKEALDCLSGEGYKCGLVTSRMRPTTLEGLEAYGLDKYFDDIVTKEDCSKHKPDPQPIDIMLAKLGSNAENSVMVGDTLFDIMCAKNAGVTSLLVGWAVAVQADKLSKEQSPDMILEDPSELLEIIKKL
jgi:pyrophosphatase PpaX